MIYTNLQLLAAGWRHDATSDDLVIGRIIVQVSSVAKSLVFIL